MTLDSIRNLQFRLVMKTRWDRYHLHMMPLYQFERDQVVTREMADFISFSRTTWKLSCWTLLKSESQLAAQKTEGTLAPARCKHLLIQYHRVYTPHSVSEWGPQTTVGSSLSSYTMPNDAQHYISITSFIVNTFIRCILIEILMAPLRSVQVGSI